MPEVASADVVLEEVGLADVIRALDQFSEKVESSMMAASKATEAATEVSGSSIVAFAALGAAMGTVFVDFIRQSSVITTLGSAFGAIFGSVADRILIKLVPSIVKLIPHILDLGDTIVEMSDRVIERLIPAFDDAIEKAGALGDAFASLDVDTQDLIAGIGALTVALLLVPAHPIAALILGFLGLLLIAPAFEAAWNQHILPALTAVFDAIVGVDVAIEQFLSDTIGAPAEQALRDFAHNFQIFSANLAFGAALFVLEVQDAWGGLVRFFEDLWRTISGGATTAWDSFAAIMTGAWDVVVGAFRVFVNTLTGLLIGFLNPFIASINAVANIINSTVGIIPGVPEVPILPLISIPTLQRGAEILEPGLVFVHRKEVVLPAPGATVGPLPAAAGGGGGQTFEFNTTYHITSAIPVGGVAMEAFKRMLDQHSREDAERKMSQFRRRL